MTYFFHFSCKMQSDLRRHREFHNAVLAHHCDFEGCNFSARAMQTVKRHQKVDHQVGSLSNITNRYQWIARCFVFFLSSVEIQLEHHETQLEPRSWKFSRSKGLSTYFWGVLYLYYYCYTFLFIWIYLYLQCICPGNWFVPIWMSCLWAAIH